MKHIIIFIYFLYPLLTHSQLNKNFVYQEDFSDTISIRLDSVLILGAGATPTRIFLENISNNLIESFSKKSIKTKYSYIGKSVEELKKHLDTINKAKYNGIILLLPKGYSIFENKSFIKRNTFSTYNWSLNTFAHKSKFEYKQDFIFQLCLPQKNMKIIWTAFVLLDYDLSNKKMPNKVSKKILDSFKKKNYIN